MTRFEGTDPSGPKTDVLTYWPPCLHILWWVLTLCNILINTWGTNVVSSYSGVTSLVQAQGNNRYMYYQTWDFVLLLLQPIAEAKLSVSWIWSHNSRGQKKFKKYSEWIGLCQVTLAILQLAESNWISPVSEQENRA